jgi:hypothetical protein
MCDELMQRLLTVDRLGSESLVTMPQGSDSPRTSAGFDSHVRPTKDAHVAPEVAHKALRLEYVKLSQASSMISYAGQAPER